jgi:hypothetical protein
MRSTAFFISGRCFFGEIRPCEAHQVTRVLGVIEYVTDDGHVVVASVEGLLCQQRLDMISSRTPRATVMSRRASCAR